MAGEVVTLHDAADRRFDVELVGHEQDGGLAVRWHDGRRLIVPAAAIERRDGAVVRLALPFGDLMPDPADGGTVTVPVVEERLVVDKHARPTSTVRVRTRPHEREEEVDARLIRETVDVKRVPVGRYVEAPGPVREEGNTTIVPLYEEVLVVEKRLLLREELHLTKHKETRRETRRVRLRTEEAEIERTEPDEA